MSFANGLKSIIVATDLDGRSDAALEYARKLALAYQARIVLAYGLDPLDYAAVENLPGRIRKGLPEEARAVLDQMTADLIREGIHSHSEIRQGAVAQMLADVARQYEAGLIVLGTEGRQGAGPVIVGTVAEQLVRLAPCAVMAVAADWNAGSFRPTPGGPILLAVEKNESTPAAVATASSLATVFQRTLVVLHARRSAEAAAFLNPRGASLKEFGIEELSPFPIRYIVKDGPPEHAIANAIEQYRPSVLVVGAKRSSESAGPHGTAFLLLTCSRVPVICVPPDDSTGSIGKETCASAAAL